MVEGARLESVYTGNRIEGSNPSLSATCPCESVLPIRLRPDFSAVFEGYAGGAEHWLRSPEGPEAFSRGRYSPDLLTASIW